MEIEEKNINRFIYAIFNLMQGLKKGMDECCTSFGDLSEKEFVIINYVGQKQNVKMSEIADSLSAPLSTVTSMVDRLVERKYLARYHSNEDRRVVLVTLSSKGKETYHTFILQKKETAKKVLSHLELKEQKSLIQYLEKIPSEL